MGTTPYRRPPSGRLIPEAKNPGPKGARPKPTPAPPRAIPCAYCAVVLRMDRNGRCLECGAPVKGGGK